MRLINFNPDILNLHGVGGYICLGSQVSSSIPNLIHFSMSNGAHTTVLTHLTKDMCYADYWHTGLSNGACELTLEHNWDNRSMANMLSSWSLVFTHQIDKNGKIIPNNFMLSLNSGQARDTRLLAAGRQSDGTVVGLFILPASSVIAPGGIPCSARTGNPLKVRGAGDSFVQRNIISKDSGKGVLEPYWIGDFIR